MNTLLLPGPDIVRTRVGLKAIRVTTYPATVPLPNRWNSVFRGDAGAAGGVLTGKGIEQSGFSLDGLPAVSLT